MAVQRQFARELHAGEDDELEFPLDLVENSVFITFRLIGSCALRCRCGEQICEVLDHEPEGDN